MRPDWMSSKNKSMGPIVEVAPYIFDGEFKKYYITHEQEICETRLFGAIACEVCEHPIEKEPLVWHNMEFCSWKCLKDHMEANKLE